MTTIVHSANFNPAWIVMVAGFSSAIDPTGYSVLISQVPVISSTVLFRSGKMLQASLALKFDDAANSIEEFFLFPPYMDRLRSALMKPEHVDVVEAPYPTSVEYFKEELMGSWPELADAQAYAYANRGTLRDWKLIYGKFMRGRGRGSLLVSETLSKRLDYMSMNGNQAPFWIVIDQGNVGMSAYPETEGTAVTSTMDEEFFAEMKRAQNEVIRRVRIMGLELRAINLRRLGQYTINVIDNKSYYVWESASGKTYAVIRGTERYSGTQHFQAKVLEIDQAGNFIGKEKSWFIPRKFLR